MAEAEMSLRDELNEAFSEPADDGADLSVVDTDAPLETDETGEIDVAVETEATAEEAPAEDAPPDSWSDEDKALFAALKEMGETGVNAQKFILNSHKSHQEALDAANAKFTETDTSMAEYRKQWDPVEQLFAPYKAQMEAAGATPASQIQHWADVELNFQQDPISTVTAMLNNVGINIYDLPVQGEEGHVDPSVAALKTELTSLREQLNRRDSQEVSTRRATIEQKIQSLAEEKDAEGNLVRPYFDEVIEELTNLATLERQSGREPDLGALYTKAVRMNDDVFTKVKEAEAAAAEEKRIADAKEKAAKAKVAGAGLTGQSDANPSEDLSIRQELQRQLGN